MFFLLYNSTCLCIQISAGFVLELRDNVAVELRQGLRGRNEAVGGLLAALLHCGGLPLLRCGHRLAPICTTGVELDMTKSAVHHPKRETSKIEIGCLSWVYFFTKNLTAMNNTSWKFWISRGSRTRKFPSMYPIGWCFQTKREWVKNKQLDYWPISSTSQTLRSKWTQRRLSTLTYCPVLGLQCCYTLVIHFGSNCHNSLHCNWTHNPKAHLQSIEFAKSIIVPWKKTDSMMLVFFAMTKSTFEKHWEAFHHPTQTQRNLSCWCLKRFWKGFEELWGPKLNKIWSHDNNHDRQLTHAYEKKHVCKV